MKALLGGWDSFASCGKWGMWFESYLQRVLSVKQLWVGGWSFSKAILTSC